MSFHDQVVQITNNVLNRPEYSVAIKELLERIDSAKATERGLQLDEKLSGKEENSSKTNLEI